MPRFTISHHAGSPGGDHYDLMLETGDVLRTWRLQHTNFQNAQAARPLKDHRKGYLDYEGNVPGGRGRVQIWDTGAYVLDEDMPGRLRLGLSGHHVRTRLAFLRGPDDPKAPEPPWTVADATTEVRKLASSFLRGPGLEDAPMGELNALREALLREEQRILSLVDRYAHGGPVEWPAGEASAAIFQQIDREKARWQHPWLAAAKRYADRLADLDLLLRRQRPGAAARP